MNSIFTVLLLALLMGLNTAQKTSYGPISSCCKQDQPDPQVDWERNMICNGDFEQPRVDSSKRYTQQASIQCWSGENNVQIGQAQIYTDFMNTQVLELDVDKSADAVKQVLNLTEGKYELKFDYASRKSHSPSQSSFFVYFNGIQILKIRPGMAAKSTVTHTLIALKGDNVLQFVDGGKAQQYGAVIDNVGIYPWKSNGICQKETEAVGAGYPVTYISVLDEKHNNYQLDSGYPSFAYAWCPIHYTTVGQWIQVSSASGIKLWTSVIVQGRTYDPKVKLKKFKLRYTINGIQWFDYEDGKQFSGTIDQTTKVRHNLKPFYATQVRLIVTEFYYKICFRFGMTFLNQ